MDAQWPDSAAARRQTPPAVPPPSGVRLPWDRLPAAVRGAVEELLGDRVADAVTQPGGFSPGTAARVRLSGGGRAFVKAVGPAPNPRSPGLHRAEARIAAALPDSVPAPRLLGSVEVDGWVALAFEDVAGRAPAEPWVRAELDRVLAALAELAQALTPSPVAVPAIADARAETFSGWRRLARARAGGDRLAGLDPWAARRLGALAGLEAGWAPAAAGGSLVHCDLRADNLLLTPERVVVVDWPWACLAQPWFDLLAMLPSVRMQGGPPPEEIFAVHPVARGADPAAVTSVLAAIAGYFVHASRQPPEPGLPTVRAFQHAQGQAALAWLRERTGWS